MKMWFEKILCPSKVLTFLFIVILLFGIKSLIGLKKDVFPLTDIDTMIIQVSSPGSSAKDVEVNAVTPIERKIKEISGIKNYSSISNPDGAIIYLYLERGLGDTRQVKDEIYRTIVRDNIDNLGPDVDDIKVIDANPKLMPVINIALTAKGKEDILKLFSVARKVQNSLEKIPGVSEVRTTGMEDPEIHIELDANLLEKYYISIDDVWMALRNRNVHVNGGSLQSLKSYETIVSISRFASLSEIENVVIRSNYLGHGVKVKDVAKVTKHYTKENNILRVDMKRGVLLQVTKRENADVLKVVKLVRNWLGTKGTGNQFEGFDLIVMNDKGVTIESMLGVLKTNAILGFILVFMCLLLFLDLRTSFWTAMGIPISLLITAIGMQFFDISINIITLGAVITILGMLVDDGIVVADAMYRSRESNFNRKETANELSKLFWPLVVAIGTTIVAFLPLASVGGMMGKFIRFYPIVITMILLASLFESTVLLPHHLRNTKKTKQKKWFGLLKNVYGNLLDYLLKRKAACTSIFIMLLLVASFVGAKSFKKFILLWDDSSEGIYVNVELPDGTNIYKMDEEIIRLGSFVSKSIAKEHFNFIQSIAGHHTVKRIRSEGDHENWGQVLINLVPRVNRSRNAKEIIRDLKSKLEAQTWPFTSLVLEEQVLGPSPGEGVEIAISGKQHDERVKLLNALSGYILKQKGVASLQKSGISSTKELKIIFDFEMMAKLGVSVSQVSQTIRAAFNGIIATEDPLPDYTLKYRVQLSDEFKGNKKTIMELLIPNKEKKLIPLKTFAKLKSQHGIGQIYHAGGSSNLMIKAQTNLSELTPRQLAKKVKNWWKKNNNKYKDMKVAIKGEAKETKDSIRDLVFALIVSLALIYMVLVLLFNSYLTPVIVFSVLPFGAAGAIIAFMLHGIPLNFMGMVGIIGLSGILVNDSIILVNSFTKSIKMDVKDAALSRFRPIVLTTITTVFGLIPSVYGIGGDIKTLVPVAVAICFGLIVGTFANLFLLPILLSSTSRSLKHQQIVN